LDQKFNLKQKNTKTYQKESSNKLFTSSSIVIIIIFYIIFFVFKDFLLLLFKLDTFKLEKLISLLLLYHKLIKIALENFAFEFGWSKYRILVQIDEKFSDIVI